MNDKEQTKCIYLHLPESQANRFEQATDKNEVLIEYMRDFKKTLHGEFECMDEDILAFQGMLARAKARFTEVKEQHLSDCYEVWEGIDEKMPNFEDRAKSLERKLENSTRVLESLNKKIEGVNSYHVKSFIENISTLSTLMDNLDEKKIEKLTKIAAAMSDNA